MPRAAAARPTSRVRRTFIRSSSSRLALRWAMPARCTTASALIRPVIRGSKAKGSCPASVSAATNGRPMKPEAPVTATFTAPGATRLVARIPAMALRFYPVILSGGSGTRLWPMSRKLLPKQFLALLSRHTLFQETAMRVQAMDGCEPPIVVCNDEQRFLAADQLQRDRRAGRADDPRARRPQHRACHRRGGIRSARARPTSTAPRAALRPHRSRSRTLSARMPPPHLRLAEAGHLATFGIVPSAPETGFGYIERGAALEGGGWKSGQRSARSPTARARKASWPAAASFGTAACLRSPATKYLEELQRLRAGHAGRGNRGVSKERSRPRFPAPRARSLRQMPVELHRLRGDGEDQRRGRRADRSRAGATSAPGARCGPSARRTRAGNVAVGDVYMRDSRRLLRTLARSGTSRPSASRTSSSSRRRTRCSSPRRTAART